MLLQDKYIGTETPFEGNLTVWLRSLPAGAKVNKATIMVERTGSDEIIDFTQQPPTFGATKTQDDASFIEVDFHARRTLENVSGSVVGTGNIYLQVDMGGVYVAVADDGTLNPSKPNGFPVDLSGGKVALPGLTVSKFRLNGATGLKLKITQVNIRSFPSNVSVRVGQLPAFWTHLGDLSTSDTSPDFAPVLNAFLATAQPQNGFYAIPFIIHSDTLAQLNATVQIDYFIDQSVLPAYLPEVTMTYAFNPLPDIDASNMTAVLPAGAVPMIGGTTAQVRGDFQPTRVALKAVSTSSTIANVVVSPDSSLAQPFQSPTEISLTGIDLPLSKALPDLTGLNVAIQADHDGKPSGQVLIRADIVVGKPLPDQSTWGSATLPLPFRILANQVYWLVLESLVGQAAWQSTPTNVGPTLAVGLPAAGVPAVGLPALQSTLDGGLSWRPANAPEALAPLSAQFRLRTIPTTFTIPIQLDIGNKPNDVIRPLDEFAPLGRVELKFGFADKLAEHLSNVAAVSPCGTADLVSNGDFSAPPPDDANKKLFGIESKPAGANFIPTIVLGPTTNLSVARFVTLSLDSTKPSIRVNCAGINPAQTTPDEIVSVINQAMRQQVTTFQNGSLTLINDVTLYPWCKNELPTSWQGTPAQTYRFRSKMPDGNTHTVVMLTNFASQADSLFVNDTDVAPACFQPGSSAANNAEASLTQRLSVTAGCTYQLSILFQLLQFASINYYLQNSPDLSPASWTVSWLDTNGNVLQIVTEPFDNIDASSYIAETLLLAPANATNVDILLTNSSPNTHALILGSVSFAPTSQTLRNSTFQQFVGPDTNRVPAGWTLESGNLTQTNMQLTLLDNSSDTTILSQTVNVIAGNTYELHVSAHSEKPLPSDPTSLQLPQHARLELQWQSNGQPGDVITLTLDGQTFTQSAWSGIAPQDITQAVIRLIQPNSNASNSLLVTSVTLTQSEIIPVPLTFLSDAPGQLTVSSLHVVYDLPASARPKQPMTTALSSGSSQTPAQLSLVSDGTAATATMAPPITAAMSPLVTILGIGEARALQLENGGIDSLDKLAQATPNDIVQLLKGVTEELATRFIEEAKQILAFQRSIPASELQ